MGALTFTFFSYPISAGTFIFLLVLSVAMLALGLYLLVATFLDDSDDFYDSGEVVSSETVALVYDSAQSQDASSPAQPNIYAVQQEDGSFSNTGPLADVVNECLRTGKPAYIVVDENRKPRDERNFRSGRFGSLRKERQ